MVNSHITLDERENQLRLDLQELYSSMQRNKTLRADADDISDFMRGYTPSTYLQTGLALDANQDIHETWEWNDAQADHTFER